jgi:hypothetical protein
VVVQGAGARVAEDHRGEGRVERGVHRHRRHVGEVDENADALHLPDDRPAFVVEAVDPGLPHGAVGPRGVLVVGQGDVADAEPRERPQHPERRRQAVPALDPEQRGDPPAGHRPLDVAGAVRDGEVVRVGRGHPVDGVDLLHRRHDRLGLAQVPGHVHRPELPADPALAQPRDVRVQLRTGLVQPVHPVSVPSAQLHGQIVVPVDDRLHAPLATRPRAASASRP